MGLGINVGFLAGLKGVDDEGVDFALQQIAALNLVLLGEGLVKHVEPTSVKASGWGAWYSGVQKLRRAYLCVMQGTPLRTGDLTSDDETRLFDEVCMFSSHLLCHSDSEGVYVPQDFKCPIPDDFDSPFLGGLVGSSQGLLRELDEVAELIGAPKKRTGPTLKAWLDGLDEADALLPERLTFVGLYSAALLSIETGSLIVFA